MSEVLNEIRTRVGEENLSTLRSRSGCGVNMTDAPSPRIVIDADRAFPAHGMTGKRCDRLLFYAAGNNLVASPIELKSGRAEQSDVVEQLQNSLHFAANIVPRTRTLTTVYRPILFQGRGIKWTNRRGPQELNVNFRGRKTRIRVGRCGIRGNLVRALSEPDIL